MSHLSSDEIEKTGHPGFEHSDKHMVVKNVEELGIHLFHSATGPG
jgi:hypothetical protein